MIQEITTEDNPRPTVSQLADALGESRQAVHQRLRRYERDGLVTLPKMTMTGKLAVLAKGRKLVER